jgi:CheY-like chemotaxis protein
MGAADPLDRDIEADVTAAVDGFPWVDGVYVLSQTDLTRAHPDALSFAIVLSPYRINELVEAHYAVLAATGTHEVAGRVLYVDGAMLTHLPLARARRIVLTAEERQLARERAAQRKPQTEELTDSLREELKSGLEEGLARVERLNRELRELLDDARRFIDESGGPSDPSPYRGYAGSAILATFARGGLVIDVVKDPFPAPSRRRILVVDDDEATLDGVRAIPNVDVVHAADGWTAIDQLTEGEFDLVLCAVVLGDFTGAKIHRMVVKARPAMASRMVFIARESVVSQAPPSSASARVLSRPVDPAAVVALLERIAPSVRDS